MIQTRWYSTGTGGLVKLMAVMIRGLGVRTRMFNLHRRPDRLLPGCREHLEILDALGAGHAEVARSRMIAHLDNVRQSIFQRLVER
jgi:DNA-binding GntR family transcriptional regulator